MALPAIPARRLGATAAMARLLHLWRAVYRSGAPSFAFGVALTGVQQQLFLNGHGSGTSSALRNAGSSQRDGPPAVRACFHTSTEAASNAVCCRSASRALSLFLLLAARSTPFSLLVLEPGAGCRDLGGCPTSHNHNERGIYLSELVLSALIVTFPISIA